MAIQEFKKDRCLNKMLWIYHDFTTVASGEPTRQVKRFPDNTPSAREIPGQGMDG